MRKVSMKTSVSLKANHYEQAQMDTVIGKTHLKKPQYKVFFVLTCAVYSWAFTL